MKVITNAAWLSLSRASTDALSFVLFTLIARTFGPAGSGEYSYAFAIGMLLALFATSGLEEFGIRQYARSPAQDRPPLWSDLLFTQCVQLTLGIGLFGLLALSGVIRPSRWVVALETSAYVTGWMLARTLFVPAMAAQSMMLPALTDLGCRVGGIVCAIALALLWRPSLPWMLVGFPIAGIALLWLAVGNSVRMGAKLRLRPSWESLVRTWRGTGPFAGADLLGQFYARTDLLLIAYFLGNAQIGLYATDIKFVEVGLLPLFMLGSAAYPLLSRHAAHDAAAFSHCGRDFVRIVFFCTGWLAVALYLVVPLLLVPLFGARFLPAAALVPWIALLALMKGIETALYRLLYASRRQTRYLVGLCIGTSLIIVLNIWLIPVFGLRGAVGAAILSTASVDIVCIATLARPLGTSFLPATLGRLLLALAGTAVLDVVTHRLGLGTWGIVGVGCAAFPLLGILLGLMPDPRHSRLFHPTDLAVP